MKKKNRITNQINLSSKFTKKMKKICLLLFVMLSTLGLQANAKVRSSAALLGCTDWEPITSRGETIGRWRECTNIFGRTRLEIVHFHQN